MTASSRGTAKAGLPVALNRQSSVGGRPFRYARSSEMTESPPEPDQTDEEYPASEGPASDVGADLDADVGEDDPQRPV